MYKEAKSLNDFVYKVQSKFNLNLHGYPCPRDWQYFDQIEDQGIPKFNADNIAHDLDIGLENWSICAGFKQNQIITTTKAANKPAQLYHLYLRTVYGVRDTAQINRHWHALPQTKLSS